MWSAIIYTIAVVMGIIIYVVVASMAINAAQ